MSNASAEEEGNLLHKVKNFYRKGSSKSSPQVVAALFPILFFLSCLHQSQNAKRASSQKRHMVISIFLLCNSLILMSIGAGSIRAIKGGLDKVFKIRDRLHRICRQILR